MVFTGGMLLPSYPCSVILGYSISKSKCALKSERVDSIHHYGNDSLSLGITDRGPDFHKNLILELVVAQGFG